METADICSIMIHCTVAIITSLKSMHKHTQDLVLFFLAELGGFWFVLVLLLFWGVDQGLHNYNSGSEGPAVYLRVLSGHKHLGYRWCKSMWIDLKHLLIMYVYYVVCVYPYDKLEVSW
jgi:hypothetical protein